MFYVMEQNAVQENMDYMEYTMQRNEDGIKTKIDSINMSTQFFLSDDSLLQMLNASAIGEKSLRQTGWILKITKCRRWNG
ncbi:MAG: hypothetical protein ACLVCH_03185 [Roseburia inulinivorans]